MTVKYIQIPVDTDFKSYLKESEIAVDALSDEELEEAEAEVEARINALANPPISIFSAATSQSKNKSKIKSRSTSSWKTAGFGGFLMAAMALLFIHNQTVNEREHWQTKGLSGEASVCEVSVVQNGQESVLNSDLAYPVSGEASIYVKANCQQDVVIEGLKDGKWGALEKAHLDNGLVVTDKGPVDFRNHRGERLRLRAENGVSEEFSLTKTP
ncbi:MAG: hypothetical protein H7318_10450 [Oligoflexus sp.]|nr:hypothetical protein [Oligoflexus sp.]